MRIYSLNSIKVEEVNDMIVSSVNYRKSYWVMRLNVALTVMFATFNLESTLMINTAM